MRPSDNSVNFIRGFMLLQDVKDLNETKQLSYIYRRLYTNELFSVPC